MMRVAVGSLLVLSGLVLAQTPEPPKLLYGHDFKVRNVDEKNFTEKTAKIGVEVFHDKVGNALVAVSEAGHIAVAPFSSGGPSKKSEWITGFELRIRDGAEKSFKDSKKVAGELFKDVNSGKILIVTTQRTIAWADCPPNVKEGDPNWQYGLGLTLRPADGKDNAKGKPLGIEAYKDGTTGRLIYITDQGFFTTAAFPATPPDTKVVKPPLNLYGLMVFSRKADEASFSKDTHFMGIEVIGDSNCGQTLFLSESGGVTAIPGVAERPNPPAKPVWLRSFAVKARKGGDASFDKAGKFGIEVFEDKNSGATLYVSETGSIAALKKQ